MVRTALLLVTGVAILLFSGCGSGSVAAPGGGRGGTPQPSVIISPSKTTANVGEAITLTWSSTNATSCAASATPAQADWSGSKPTSGSGTVAPTSAGSVTYSLACTGTGGTTSQSAAVTATIPANLAITSGQPPSGTVGVVYGTPHTLPPGIPGPAFYFRLTAAGAAGTPIWSWSPAPGSTAPPGMQCCNRIFGGAPPFGRGVLVQGEISGKPSVPGDYSVMISVTDSASSATASATFPIHINPPPPPVVNTTPSPAIATLNQLYVGYAFTANGGFPPLTWSVSSGSLPAGLHLGSDGNLTGTPTASGPFPISVIAQDSLGRASPQQSFTLQVLTKGFAPTGAMSAARAFHTSNRLGSGKVLVVGGVNAAGLAANAELYDPAAGTFSSAGSLSAPRYLHTATLLKDGRVLVAGGGSDAGPLASAELFDPATGNFSTTGAMKSIRVQHAAVLLNDGKVLICGGFDANGIITSTAELFDPATGTFTPTGSMIDARDSHTATMLSDGSVLVAGGRDATQNFQNTAELFDPATGSFTAVGTMTVRRGEHTATLLNNGKVLVAGGISNSAELFDPATGAFAATGSMETSRTFHTATLLGNGMVLVAGGVDEAASTVTTLSSAELFDPASGSFSPTADMTAVREAHGATLLVNGQVLITGGLATLGSLDATAKAELFQ